MSFLTFCNSGSGCSLFLVSFSVCLYSFWNAGWRVYLFCGLDFQELWFLTLLLWLQAFLSLILHDTCPPWFQGDSTFSDCMDQKYYCLLLGTFWSSPSFSLLSWFAQPFPIAVVFPNEGPILKGIGLASSLDYMEHLVSPSLARWNLRLIYHSPVIDPGKWVFLGLFHFISVRYPLMAITPIDIDIIHYHTSGIWPSPLDYRLETPVGFGVSSSVSWSLVNVGLLAGPKTRLPLLSSLSLMFLGRLLSCHKSSQMFIHCWFLRTVCQCHCHHLPYFSFWLSWCYW